MILKNSHSLWQKNLYLLFFLLILSVPWGQAPLQIITLLGSIGGLLYFGFNYSSMKKKLWESRYLIAFLALFLPALISLPDSLLPATTAKALEKMFRYFGFGVVALIAFKDEKSDRKLLYLSALFILFFSLDAVSHWLFEFNIYGKNPIPYGGRIRGIFGERYHLGYYAATLAPLLFFTLFSLKIKRRWIKIIITLTSISLLTFTVIVSGARAGIVTLLISAILIFIYAVKQKIIRSPIKVLLFSLLFISAITVAAFQTEPVKKRFELTSSATSNPKALADRFTSNRTKLWTISINAIPDYWINGAGARAFNPIYRAAPKELQFEKLTFNSSHLYLLQIPVETGIIGFIPYLILCGYLIYRSLTARRGNAWLMVSFLGMMPLNSHVGFYETYWMPLIYGPLAIGLAQAYYGDKEKSDDSYD